jgi:radical SAM superfamily enzyme YgiQ (UPF0313 family)
MKYDVILFTGIYESTIKTFGAHKCAHELRQAGFRVLVVNQLHYFNINELKNILTQTVDQNTLFVGFSNTFLQDEIIKTNFDRFLPAGDAAEIEFTTHLKTINSNCKIVVGGTRTLFDTNNPRVDYAIIGYADLSIVNLAQHLKYNVPLVKSFQNLNKIKILNDPVAEGFDFYNSTMSWCDDDVVVPGETLMLEISRGCVFDCKFCTHRLKGKQNLDYLKKYDHINQELVENYEKYGVTWYNLLDDTYNDTKEKIDIMLSMSKKLPFEPKFWAYVRLDLLSKHPETIDKIIDTGVISMFFGIETLNKRTGSIIGKGYSREEQIRTIQYIKNKYGDRVVLTGSFICGLPEESRDSIENTMQMLMSKEIPLDRVNFNPLKIRRTKYEAWQSAFGLDMTKYGYTEIPWPNLDDSKIYHDVNWKSNIMTFQEAIDMCNTFLKQYVPNTNNQKFWSYKPAYIEQYKKQLFEYIKTTASIDTTTV